jgi:hypothetical protein
VESEDFGVVTGAGSDGASVTSRYRIGLASIMDFADFSSLKIERKALGTGDFGWYCNIC